MSALSTHWLDALKVRHLFFVDELKGVAILLVIAFHAQLAVGWTNWSQGQIGVDIFLLLSGWMIGRSLKPTTTLADFFRRRIWRIVPAYWVALGLLCLFRQMTSRVPFDWPDFIAHAFGLQIFGPSKWFFSFNSSFWFISLLLFTYPLAFVLRRERSPWTILSVGLVLGLVTYGLGHLAARPEVVLNVPARLISFHAGLAISAMLRRDVNFYKNRGLFFALFAAGGYLELTGATLLRPLFYAFALAVAYLFATGGIGEQRSRSMWTAVLAFIGSISYEVFLLHQPLLRLGVNIPVLAHLSRQVSAVLGILISFIAGWILNRMLSILFVRPAKSQLEPSVATALNDG